MARVTLTGVSVGPPGEALFASVRFTQMRWSGDRPRSDNQYREIRTGFVLRLDRGGEVAIEPGRGVMVGPTFTLGWGETRNRPALRKIFADLKPADDAGTSVEGTLLESGESAAVLGQILEGDAASPRRVQALLVAKGPDKLRQLDQASRLLPPEIPSGPRALRHVGLEVWWMAALVAVEAAWALVCTDLSLTLFWAGFLLFAGTFAYLLRLPLARLRPLTREKGLHTDRDLDASAHLKLDTPGKVITICLITAVMGTTLLQLDLLPDLPLRAMVVGLGLFALGFCAAYAVTLFGGHLGSLKRLLNSSPLASPPDGAQGWLEGTIVDEGLPAPVDRVTWPALVESEATRRPRGALVKLELRDRHLQEVPERLVLQAEVGAVELAPERDKAFWASAALISIRAPGFFTEKARREMILAGAQVRAFGKILRRTGQPSRLVPAENGPLLVFAARPGHSVAAELRLQLARWRTALALFALAGLLQTMPVVLPRLEWGKAMVSKTPAAPR